MSGRGAELDAAAISRCIAVASYVVRAGTVATLRGDGDGADQAASHGRDLAPSKAFDRCRNPGAMPSSDDTEMAISVWGIVCAIVLTVAGPASWD